MADGTVVIDATTQPQAAAAAMALFPAATNTAFTATSNPLYTNTDQSQVSNSFENPSSYPHPVAGSFTAQHDYSSSWSLGGSVSSETTLSALGFADASVSVTFTASHEWVTSHSDSQSVTANVDPGFISWVEGYTRQVTFTGDYSFTANGVSYQVNNVSMTEPGNSESGPNAASTFIVINHKLNATARRRFARPGTVPRKQTASLIKK